MREVKTAVRFSRFTEKNEARLSEAKTRNGGESRRIGNASVVLPLGLFPLS